MHNSVVVANAKFHWIPDEGVVENAFGREQGRYRVILAMEKSKVAPGGSSQQLLFSWPRPRKSDLRNACRSGSNLIEINKINKEMRYCWRDKETEGEPRRQGYS